MCQDGNETSVLYLMHCTHYCMLQLSASQTSPSPSNHVLLSSLSESPGVWSAAEYKRLMKNILLQKGMVDTQLIAHDKEVYDIAWGGVGVFASVSADGSVRVFDLRLATSCSACSHTYSKPSADVSVDEDILLRRYARCMSGPVTCKPCCFHAQMDTSNHCLREPCAT